MFGQIFTLVMMALVSFLMIGIGIAQWKSTSPVGFYTGVEPPKSEELTSVSLWNKKHGAMWMIYGAAMLLSSVVCILLGWDTAWLALPFVVSVGALPFMVWYHHHLEAVYDKGAKK